MIENKKEFSKKYKNILHNENISAAKMSRICGFSSCVSLDYKNARSFISTVNLLKLLNKFPQYTDYLLNIDSSNLPDQVNF